MHGLERDLVAAIGLGEYYSKVNAAFMQAQMEYWRERLQARGLWVSPSVSEFSQQLSVWLFSVLLALGLLRLICGISDGRPVGYLLLLMLLVLFTCAFHGPLGISHRGEQLLNKARCRYEGSSIEKHSAALPAFAVLGAMVLSEPVWADMRELLTSRDYRHVGGSGDGGGAGGGCGAGGGGGGCGGC